MAKFCSNCGSELASNLAKYCHVCGYNQEAAKIEAKFERDIINSDIVIAGRDVNIIKEGFTKCLDCLGTGLAHENCPDCGGTGKIAYYDGPKNNLQTDNPLASVLFGLKEVYERSETANWNHRECYKCGGKGRLLLGNPNNSLRAFQDSINIRNNLKNEKRLCPTCSGHGEVRMKK